MKTILKLSLIMGAMSFSSAYGLTYIAEGDSLEIGKETAVDDYVVDGGTLISNGGATDSIKGRTNAKIMLNDSQVSGYVTTGSSGNASLTGTFINNTGSKASPLAALAANQNAEISAEKVRIKSDTNGVIIAEGASVLLTNSEVVAQKDGLQLFNVGSSKGSTVTHSNITGFNSGIRVLAGKVTEESHILNVSGSNITGINDAAITVGYDYLPLPDAKIYIGENSTLSGKDNLLVNIVGESNATVTVNNSHLTGDISADEKAKGHLALENNATLLGQLTNISDLNLSSGAVWTLVKDNAVSNVVLDNGGIRLSGGNGQFNTLTLGELSGNGDFFFATDYMAGQGDFLNVEGSASGAFRLHVANSGAEPTLSADALHLVHTGGGSAEFTLAGQRVDLGTWEYYLKQDGTDWYLSTQSDATQPPPVTSSSTDAVLNLSSAPKHLFYGELDSLRNRTSDSTFEGAWGELLSHQTQVSGAAGSSYSLGQTGFITGADTRFDSHYGPFTVGAFLGNSQGSLKNTRGGKSTLNSWSAGLYGVWLPFDNTYISTALKLNNFRNKLSGEMADGASVTGRWNMMGMGSEIEAGRHFQLEKLTITPFAGARAFYGQDRDIALSNGMKAHTGGDDAFRLNAGIRAELTSEWQNVTLTPFAEAALSQEYISSSGVVINKEYTFKSKSSDTGARISAGVKAGLSNNTEIYARLSYENSEQYVSPIAASAGIRVSF